MRLAGVHTGSADDAFRALVSELETRIGVGGGMDSQWQALTAPGVRVWVDRRARPALGIAEDEEGSFLVLDGEVLSEQGSRSGPDTSAKRVLERYGEIGSGFLADLDGSFALILWDARRRSLLLARDRWGATPLYHASIGEPLLFAAQVGTLLRAGVPRDPDRVAVDHFLANGFFPSPWTPLAHVRKLPPAHRLERQHGQAPQVERYWTPTARPVLDLTRQETNDRLRELFRSALAARYGTEPATGVLLSGGVDSRLILAGVCRLLGVPGSSLDSFTFRYEDYEGEWNENEAALATARHFGTRHHELVVGPRDVSDRLDWMLRAYGEPFTFGLHSSQLEGVVKEGVGALLNGAGPDGWYLDPRNAQGLRYAQLPSPARAAVRGSATLLRRLGSYSRPLRFWRLYAAAGQYGYAMEPGIVCGETGLPARSTGIIFSPELRRRLYTDPRLVDEGLRQTLALYGSVAEDLSSETARDRIVFTHRHFVNAEGTLHWNHWWGRAHGISVRYPYFDDALTGFASRLPRRGPDKQDVRAFAETLMPREMAWSPKLPQTIPIRRWLRDPLRDFLQDHLAPERVARQGLFEPSEVRRLVREHLRGAMAHEWKLWALISLLAWEDLVSRGEL